MTTFIILIALVIPALVISVCFIIALGRRPGLRRRKMVPYDGLERRCINRKSCVNAGRCLNPPSECMLEQADLPDKD